MLARFDAYSLLHSVSPLFLSLSLPHSLALYLFPSFPSSPFSPFLLCFTILSRLLFVLILCVCLHSRNSQGEDSLYLFSTTQHAICPTVKCSNACCVQKVIAKTSAGGLQSIAVSLVYPHSHFVCAGNIFLGLPQVEAGMHGLSLQQHLHLSLHWCCFHLLPSRSSTHVSTLLSQALLMRCLRQELVCTHSSIQMRLKRGWTNIAAGLCNESSSFTLAQDAVIHFFLHTKGLGNRMDVVCQRCLWGVPELHVYLRFRYALSSTYASARKCKISQCLSCC